MPPVIPENEFLYGYARCALEDAYQLIGLKQGDIILYPDCICDVIVGPCRKLGLNVKYYPVKDDFQPEWAAVEKLVEENAKAVLTVNYFGFPQLMDKWKEIIDKYNIWWVEDNAHGYGGSYGGVTLGHWGHVSVTSLRKFIPLISGALLVINEPKLQNYEKIGELNTNSRIKLCKEEFLRCLGYFFRLGFIPYNKYRSVPKAKSSTFDQDWIRPREIDMLSKRLFPFVMSKLNNFSDQRRLIYHAWEKFCLKHDLNPVFPFLPDCISPLVFPCYADCLKTQMFWLEWGRKNGVDVHTWPNLPIEIQQKGGCTVARQDKILCFPVNQYMEISQINQLSADMKETL
jgi:hypothetical protein